MTVRNGFPDTVGNTPLIRLRRFSDETGCEILGKAEFLNPGGSVKDRAAGVQELGLAEDFAAGLVAEPAETDQWGVANGVGEAITDGHGDSARVGTAAF